MITGFIWINSRFIAENTKSLYIALEAIRDSINKAWVLGEGRFKQQIEKKTGRRASSNARGVIGDQRDIEQEKKINYSDPIDIQCWPVA